MAAAIQLGSTHSSTPNSKAPFHLPHIVPAASINPILDVDFPDPSILRVGDAFYAYATNSGRTNVQVARSRDLIHWEMLPDALPTLPTWAVQEFGWAWSPVVTRMPNGYMMYVTMRCVVDGCPMQSIAAAVSERPEGPFASLMTGPFICQVGQGGSIDPFCFVDADRSRYLLWKNDGNAIGAPTWIYAQPLSADGLTLCGEPTRLITADQPWEGILVEAPTLWRHANHYYLFYSANHFTSSGYAIGCAVADKLTGRYSKAHAPVLATDPRRGIVGPGGQDLLYGPDDETWMLYHAWSLGGCRHMQIAHVIWKD